MVGTLPRIEAMLEARAESNSAVERAARLLRALGTGRPSQGLGLSEVALTVGLHKTTALRLLVALERTGLVERGGDGRYRVGSALLELASAYIDDLDLVEQAHPVLDRLSAATLETAHLGVLSGHDVVYLDKVESSQSLRMVSRVGSRNPTYCTGMGKALLAHAGEDVLTAVIAAGLKPRTVSTLVDKAELRADLSETRQRGYALDREENKVGIRCVAAEIRDRRGRVIGAISVSGPSTRMDDETLARHALEVRRAADEISRRMGFQPVAMEPAVEAVG
ncbi:MAG: IclR family transcriptional regulator, partial [Chloroflexi bacterium]|nr:IclR family transcriptional regulator [Chloroflexota bacterium]